MRPIRSSFRSTLSLLVAGLLVACGKPTASTRTPTAPPTAVEAERDDLAARLRVLEERLAAAREEMHVPGMAIAIVRGDEVIYSQGFGYADLEAKKPATPDTIFVIGSSTKAFTATTVGMMVEGGKLGWDDPIDEHVPELQLDIDSPDANAKATLRDALCHRTGFTRMSLAWVSDGVNRSELFQTVSKAEAWAPYRERFLYNNVLYAAAGEAAGRAAGTTWEAFVTERLFAPLKMRDSSVEIAGVRNDPRLARGYAWRETAAQFQPTKLVPGRAIAPAGSINSTATDMAKWLRLQLGRGSVDGRRIVGQAIIEETWKPQMKITPDLAYGLGWFVGDWQGKREIQHGGNIDGYSAAVAMLPDEQLGLVLLTNVSYTPLQGAVRDIVWSSLLDPLDEDAPTEDLSKFVGEYVADFGPFDDAKFVVTDEGGKLFVDIPGQAKVELKPPDAKGRRALVLAADVAFEFEPPAGKSSNVMRLHQAGAMFELYRPGYEPAPEIALAELRPLLGRYHHHALGTADVLIQHNRLAIRIPKQMTYELHPPDAEGRRLFRFRPDFNAKFTTSPQGTPIGFVIEQPGVTSEFKFVGAAVQTESDLPKLMKKLGMAKLDKALAKAGAVQLRGKVRFAQSGVSGTFHSVYTADGRHSTTLDLGRFGVMRSVHDGQRAWTDVSFGTFQEHLGKYAQQTATEHPLVLWRDWTRTFDDVEAGGRETVDDRKVVRVVLREGELPPRTIYVDPDKGEVTKSEAVVLDESFGGSPNTVEYGDYRRALGVRLPHRIVTAEENVGRIIVELDAIEPFAGPLEPMFERLPEKR